MRILVTGATGFVGRHLVKSLNEDKHEVQSLNSSKFSSMWYLPKDHYDVIIHLAVKTAAGGYC